MAISESPTTGRTEVRANRVPVSLITGFLGSGKTTLLNHLVKQPGMEATALIINEFGEVGLDHLLVESAIENTLLLENGCICCSIRGDLVDTLLDLFRKAESGELPEFDRILIETTGIADPVPIVRTLDGDPAAANHCRLDQIVTVVDGVQGLAQLSDHDEVAAQVAVADIMLLSKADLADPEATGTLRAKLAEINPTARIQPLARGAVDPDDLFHAGGVAGRSPMQTHAEHPHGHAGGHHHGAITTCAVVHGPAVDEARFRAWLRMIVTLRPHALLRAKGYVRIQGENRPLILQAVGPVVSPPEFADAWPGEKPETRFVLIFRGMDPDAVTGSFGRYVAGGADG